MPAVEDPAGAATRLPVDEVVTPRANGARRPIPKDDIDRVVEQLQDTFAWH